MKSRSQESCAPADPTRPRVRRGRQTEILVTEGDRCWMKDVYPWFRGYCTGVGKRNKRRILLQREIKPGEIGRHVGSLYYEINASQWNRTIISRLSILDTGGLVIFSAVAGIVTFPPGAVSHRIGSVRYCGWSFLLFFMQRNLRRNDCLTGASILLQKQIGLESLTTVYYALCRLVNKKRVQTHEKNVSYIQILYR